MQTCGSDCLEVYFNVRTCDIWEGNMTIRSEIQTKRICPLGFQVIREGVTLRRLTLQSEFRMKQS